MDNGWGKLPAGQLIECFNQHFIPILLCLNKQPRVTKILEKSPTIKKLVKLNKEGEKGTSGERVSMEKTDETVQKYFCNS